MRSKKKHIRPVDMEIIYRAHRSVWTVLNDGKRVTNSVEAHELSDNYATIAKRRKFLALRRQRRWRPCVGQLCPLLTRLTPLMRIFAITCASKTA